MNDIVHGPVGDIPSAVERHPAPESGGTFDGALSGTSRDTSAHAPTADRPERGADRTASLTGRVALVTGASRGIGRAVAARLAREGAHVIAHHSGRSPGGADALAAEIHASGGRVDVIDADLAAPDAAHRVARAVRDLGVEHLHVVVSNAADGHLSSLEDQTVEDFDRQVAVNLRTPFFLVQQVLPLLGEGASIVLMSSITARRVGDGAAVYSATKGAIEVLTRTLAKELGSRGIRVNAVAPGVIDTDMARFALSTEDDRTAVTNMQALKRIGQPDDVADVVLFLASDQSGWVDGRLIEPSGGESL